MDGMESWAPHPGSTAGATTQDLPSEHSSDMYARKSKREADELERKRAEQAEFDEHKAKQRRVDGNCGVVVYI